MKLESNRGRIPPPNLDDRTWQDLVNEMRALIPTYAPQWTDHNPSDLGITLIELFAWLGESVIYRLNQTPEKNYVAFLQLLGITRDPPTPAYTYLTFTASDGGGAVTVPAGTQAQSAGVRGETPIVFETDEDVLVQPTNLVAAVEVGPYTAGDTAATYVDATASLVGPPAAKHLITVPPHQVLQLCLGFDERIGEEIELLLRLYRGAPPAPAEAPDQPPPLSVTWVYSKGALEPMDWPVLAGAADSTDALQHGGSARVKVPAGWGRQRPTAPPNAPAGGPQTWAEVIAADAAAASTDARFWIGARIANDSATSQVVGIERVLFNSALARSASTIRVEEDLGVSTGTAFQTFQLARHPLFQRPDVDEPYGGLVIQVGSGTPKVWKTWSAVEDFAAGPGEVFRVDPVPGEVSFGNHDPSTGAGRGSIPVRGARIRAARYRYVSSGAAGNVAAGQVQSIATTLAGAVPTGIRSVVNLGPGLDGADEEPIDDALRRAPQQLKIRDRAVTAEDFEYLAREATNDIVISACLGPRLLPSGDPWSYGAITRAPGAVNVIIVPDQGEGVPRPEPTADQLRLVRDHLEQRRDLTAHLQVLGPRYLPVKVTVAMVIWEQGIESGADLNIIRADTLAAIQRFLHPTRGGPDSRGWQVGQPVFSSDVFRAIMPPPELGYISNLQLQPDIPAYHFPPLNPAGTATNWKPSERPYLITEVGASVRVADYELVCAPLTVSAHTFDAKIQPR